MYRLVVFIVFIILLDSCKKPLSSPFQTYIYLSHIRFNNNRNIYAKLYDVDYSKYNMILLGGDLSKDSFKEQNMLSHLDSIFDLKSPNTLWSVGNHDETSSKKFYETTGKNKYHAYGRDDVVFITLDSQDSLSSIVGEQKEFLFSVLDTVQSSSILIMSHKLIFMNGHPIMDSKISKVCNANKGDCYYCHNPNNFQEEIYPKLVELRKKRKQIIWV